MKVGIMQPYLFPYIGYFQLIKHVDTWIVFDDVQYISRGWINRNRILHPDTSKEWRYITVPVVKHRKSSLINEIEINNKLDWQIKIMGQLESYKKKSPYYKDVKDIVWEIISYDCSNLSDFVINSLKITCNVLDINFDFQVYSKMNLDIGDIEHSGQWAVKIASAVGANEYINPVGGYDIFIKDEFEAAGIKLKFLQANLTPYIQRQGFFVPGLSIIDVMMWNDPATIKDMLDDYLFITKNYD